jgi:hypothetical protein
MEINMSKGSGSTIKRMPKKLKVTGAEKSPKILQDLRLKHRSSPAKKITKTPVVKLQSGGLVGKVRSAQSGRAAKLAKAEATALRTAPKKVVQKPKTLKQPNAANKLAQKNAGGQAQRIAAQRKKDLAAIAAKRAAKS